MATLEIVWRDDATALVFAESAAIEKAPFPGLLP